MKDRQAPTQVEEGELIPKIPFRFSAINKGNETHIMALGAPGQIAEILSDLGDKHGVPVVRVVITYKNLKKEG